MTKEVAFHFDFGSPNAYLSHKAIPGIERRTGAKFIYFPVLLGGVFKLTNNRSPMEKDAGVSNKPAYERRETERFVARHGIAAFRMNPHFPVNTLRLMRGALAAEEGGFLTAYVEAAFHHMWEAPKKLDEPKVLRGALDESGLDGAALLALIEDPEIKRRLLTNTRRSVDAGAFGCPTFFVAGEMYFGKDRLRDVEEALLESGTRPMPLGRPINAVDRS